LQFEEEKGGSSKDRKKKKVRDLRTFSPREASSSHSGQKSCRLERDLQGKKRREGKIGRPLKGGQEVFDPADVIEREKQGATLLAVVEGDGMTHWIFEN